MNILPLVVALLLVLSVMTVEKYENFKNSMIVQEHYLKAIQEQDRKIYNKREEALFGKNDKINYKKLSFRPFIEKEMREPEHLEKYRQYRQVTIDLIKVLYSHADFFKKAERQRHNLIEDMLDAIQEKTAELPEGSIKRIQDISRIQLEDPILQNAFYHMLKGTMDKDDYKTMQKEAIKEQKKIEMNPEKIYFSLLTFLNYNGARNQNGKVNPDYNTCKIELGLAPRELLLAIYGDESLVDEIIRRRIEITQNRAKGDKEGVDQFKQEFEGKQKQGIIDILDYNISSTPKKDRD